MIFSSAQQILSGPCFGLVPSHEIGYIPRMRPIAPLILMLLGLVSCRTLRTTSTECPRTLRAIFDVGSGTTKLNVYEVSVCPDGAHLVRVIDDRTTRSVSLEAAKNSHGVITPAGLDELRTVVGELRDHAFKVARERAPTYASVDFAAAGTHAYRTAKNHDELAEALSDLGIPIVMLSQGEEANLAYDGATRRVTTCGTREKITWDIGGGSIQFTRADGSFRGLTIGAEGFKSRLVTEFHLSGKPRCEAKIESANPLGPQNVDGALKLAAQHGFAGSDPRWASLKDACVIGVGGLHARSVLERIHLNWPTIKSCVCPAGDCRPTPGIYHQREVECLARVFASKRDCDPEIRGPYAGMGESNLILIAGIMRALEIDEVHVVDVNMGQALAIDDARLKFRRLPIPPLTAP